MADKVFAAERTRQAIAAAEKGDVQDARTLLAEALTLDPDYELAWLWFAAVTEDRGEEKFCLQKVKDLDPQHKALPALGRLAGVKSAQPPELTAIIDPPPPEFITGYADEARQARRSRLIRRLLVGLAVVAVIAAVAAVWANSRVKTTYLAMVIDSPVQAEGLGPEKQTAAQLAVDTWNNTEATSQEQIEVVTFYDDGDPEKAKQVAQQIVDDGRFAGVIGHNLSRTSSAAAPIYQAAGIPAITPAATADDVTAGNPWYYRTVFDNTTQGEGMARYALGVEEATKVAIVATDDSYGRSVRDGFVRTFTAPSELSGEKQRGEVLADITIPAESDDYRELVAAAREVADTPGVQQIVYATGDSEAVAFLDELQSRGVKLPVLVPDSLAQIDFYTHLAELDESLLRRVRSATPLNAGTLVGPAVDLYDQMTEILGYTPGWTAGTTYDAVNAFTEAMRRGEVAWGTDDLAADREKIRAELDAARTPETALPTVTGRLYFDADNAAVSNVAFDSGHKSSLDRITLQSAPYQVSTYTQQAGVSLDEQLANGWAFVSDGETFTVQRVVSAGFNINEITDLDPATQTFIADFFLWFKYEGGAGLPTDVQFVNAVDPSLALGEPDRISNDGKEEYRLYRVKGTFRAPMAFNDFPFDEQFLPVTIQNRTATAAQITYVPDPDNAEQSQADRLRSGTNADDTIDQIPNWQADFVSFFPSSVGNTGALGDPQLLAGNGVTFSQMSAGTTISRDVPSFLVKNLLPLILLTIVVYFSLWYPYKDAPARVTFGVTGILTGAVMLNSVTGSLPQVDYTVAIEWAYYAFILLAGICIVATLVGRHLTETRQLARVRVLDRIMRVGYPLYVFAVFLGYWFAFRG